ncbi:MAG: anti-sigma F factor [Eubacteriales bacterium]|nr:anti-sigma F factor [Eubacteriales bacterium]
MKIRNEIRADFLSIPENVAFARMTVAAFLVSEDPTLEELGDIKTAVSEAATNAIVHGYREKEGMVRLRALLYEGGEVELEIIDNGCGIEDVEQARRPFFSGDGDERAGMGFLVMESFMDSVDVISAPGEGTTVRMRRRLGADASAAARP